MYQKYCVKSDFNNCKIINSIQLLIENPITIIECSALFLIGNYGKIVVGASRCGCKLKLD